MMHCKSLKTMLTVAAVVGVAFAAPNKNEMSNEITPSGAFITKNKDGVSASWGGFQAAASLADDGSAVASAGGNGLGAGAGYGASGVGAGAGVYGNGAASAGGSYGNGGKPGSAGGSPVYSQGGGFFDRIFAIPINVLQSVNTYLNQKQQGQPGAAYPAKPGNKVPEATVGAADYGHSEAYAGASAGAGAAAGGGAHASAAHGKAGDSMMVQANKNFDEVFNIPITALRSVRDLLNG